MSTSERTWTLHEIGAAIHLPHYDDATGIIGHIPDWSHGDGETRESILGDGATIGEEAPLVGWGEWSSIARVTTDNGDELWYAFA